MITHLRIKNFKAWKDSGDIRMAPITVLFGTNSAGKTSIPQLLLLLKQTAESSDRQRVLHFGDARRTAIELGDFSAVVHNHDTANALEMQIGWRSTSPLTISDPLSKRRITGDEFRFEATIEADARRNPFVRELEFTLFAGRKQLRAGMRRRGSKYDLTTHDYDAKRQAKGRKWALPAPVQFFGFPDEAVAYYQNTGFVSDLNLEMTRLLDRVHYVGPLREYPRRLYQWSGEVPVHVGIKGDRAIEAILAARGRQFNFGYKQKLKSLDELVGERLQTMGLVHAFDVRVLAEHRKEYEVFVRTGPKRPDVLLTDVGFGISQVLPVIVECFYVPAHSIVIFEQPEIHLHPAVQADLADLFVDAIRARENGADRHVQFIIESHSEHFLRRLQLRIAEERLTPDDAALYFVHTDEDAARFEALKVDRYGNILNWPENFFGDEMGDLVARTEAQAHRMKHNRAAEGT